MSSTSYQTTAKPRGRRGSHGETPDKPARSRASSSASTKLSKTLSRTLDEVSVPRNSRPTSPAIHLYRQRTVDSKISDQTMASRHPALSLRSDRGSRPHPEAETISIPISPVKAKAHIVHDVHQFEVHEPGQRSVSPSKLWKQSTAEAADRTAESSLAWSLLPPHSSQGLGRKSHSSKSLASMQPTVAEETEDYSTTETSSLPRKQSLRNPVSVDFVTPTSKVSKSSLDEEDRPLSPRTSKPPLEEWYTAPRARTSTSSLHEPLVAPVPQAPIGFMHQEAMYASPRTSKSSLYDAGGLPLARSSGSSLPEQLMTPTQQGPVVFMQPSLDQRLAESVESFVPVTSSPAPTAGVAMVQDFVPYTHSPMGSPPLSPYIHQQMGSPPPQPLQFAPSYPYQYPQPFMANYPPAFYPTPFTSPTMPFHNPGEIPQTGSAGAEDERLRLLEKVSNVLPDINRLLHYYSESQGLLSEKDNLVKQTESQHTGETARLRIELSACKEEYEKIIGEQASENLSLKRELAEQAEKMAHMDNSSRALTQSGEEVSGLNSRCVKLAEEIDVGRSVNEHLAIEKRLLEDQIQERDKRFQDEKAKYEESLQKEKTILEDELQAAKNQLHEDRAQHERTKAESQNARLVELANMDEEHSRSLHEHKTGLSKVPLDLAGLITKHTQQKKDLDSARASIFAHERSMAEKRRELEEIMRKHATTVAEIRTDGEEKAERHQQEVAGWSREIAQVVAKHQGEINTIQDTHKKELVQVHKTFEGRLSEAMMKRDQREAQLQSELETTRAQVEKLETHLWEKGTEQDRLQIELSKVHDEHEALKSTNEMTGKHHAALADTMLSLKAKQAEWQRESEQMDRILMSLTQLAPSKSKSDEAFMSAFEELALSVEGISMQYFQDQPDLDLAIKVAVHSTGLPAITGSTEAARALRCLFVQHQIFRVLHRRVFQPFILTSAYDDHDDYGLDASLTMMSNMIAAKSVRREAIWRTITTQAFYATEYGRRAAGVVATSVSIEVMEKVSSMASVEALPPLLESVRMLSKRAVELWRQVRVQSKVVRSSMPSNRDMEMSHNPSAVLLWIRPHVASEGFGYVADFEDSGPVNASGTAESVYLQGTALSQDSPTILARRQELRVGL